MGTNNNHGQTTPIPGAYFGWPGETINLDQFENTKSLATTLASGASVNVQGILPFQQTDIIRNWIMQVSLSQTISGAAVASPYAPYNYIGPLTVSVQNQYNLVRVQSGVDLAIWQLFNPRNKYELRDNLTAAPTTPWANSAFPGTSLQTLSGFGSGATSTYFELDLPGSIEFDDYYDLSSTGQVVGNPHRAIVSPQYMAGTTRTVLPTVTFNPINGTTLDSSPFSGASAATATSSITFRRQGYFGSSDVEVLPVSYNWQHSYDYFIVSLSGRNSVTIPYPQNGQLLSTFVRMFDPTANAPISISNASSIKFQVGSALNTYDDAPRDMQRRFMAQHDGTLLPNGVIGYDFKRDNLGRITNRLAPNTLTTQNVNMQINFNSALSSTAYAVVGTESLVYVPVA